MRAKRAPSRRRTAARPAARAGDQAGQMLDCLGLQATNSGGVSDAWTTLLVVAMAFRAAPYLAARTARRLAGRR